MILGGHDGDTLNPFTYTYMLSDECACNLACIVTLPFVPVPPPPIPAPRTVYDSYDYSNYDCSNYDYSNYDMVMHGLTTQAAEYLDVYLHRGPQALAQHQPEALAWEEVQAVSALLTAGGPAAGGALEGLPLGCFGQEGEEEQQQGYGQPVGSSIGWAGGGGGERPLELELKGATGDYSSSGGGDGDARGVYVRGMIV